MPSYSKIIANNKLFVLSLAILSTSQTRGSYWNGFMELEQIIKYFTQPSWSAPDTRSSPHTFNCLVYDTMWKVSKFVTLWCGASEWRSWTVGKLELDSTLSQSRIEFWTQFLILFKVSDFKKSIWLGYLSLLWKFELHCTTETLSWITQSFWTLDFGLGLGLWQQVTH